MLERVADRISYCQTSCACAQIPSPAILGLGAALLTDLRQYTQAAGTRPKVSNVSAWRIQACGEKRFPRTMIDFAPLLRAFACARRRR